MKKLELHWQILIGMVFGILFGFLMTYPEWGPKFVQDWISPIGTIFVKLLKLIAIPLILASLVKGISDLQDISKFKNIGLEDDSHICSDYGYCDFHRIGVGQYASGPEMGSLTKPLRN